MTKTKSILVVEDDFAIQNLVRMMLEFEGYVVFVASDFKKGIEKLEMLKDEYRPCLIVADLMMKGDGWNLVKAMKVADILIALPIVAVSAVITERELPAGIPFLKKPFSVECLIGTVKKYCELPK